MQQRGATYRDLRHALENASTCVTGDRVGRWRVTGPDLDRDDLTAVVVIEDGVVVVTMY
jgi:hypothetical protein